MKKLVVSLIVLSMNVACTTMGEGINNSRITSDNINTTKISENPAMAAVGSATPVMTTKQKLRADPEWNSVANEVVNCVVALTSTIAELDETGIYVVNLDQPSAQSKAFRSMVMTKLVQNGFKVTFEPAGAYHLQYDVVNVDGEVNAKLTSNKMDVLIRVALVKGELVITNQSELRTAGGKNSETIAQFARNL